jgi:membrane protein implicated in regulation of membrane protease activity
MSPAYFPDTVQLFPRPGFGSVDWAIAPNCPGRVSFQATTWPAKLYQTDGRTVIQPHQLVQIVGMQGITLLVQPITELDRN